MIPMLQIYKPLIDDQLLRFLAKKEKELSKVNPWGSDVVARLILFVTAGKTIRGSLVCFSYSLFQKNLPQRVYDAAAAFELFQSGLLIHDDIMDQDSQRRGDTSIHKQYEHLRGNAHFGTSMGINAADLCFFLAYELLPAQVVSLISREFSLVVIAQMQDVAGAKNQKDILTLYRYKTARYSFSVPLAVGALLANADAETISKLELLGENIGMLFQLRDDELDSKRVLTSTTIKSRLVAKANTNIDELPISATQKKDLASVVAFCQNRKT